MRKHSPSFEGSHNSGAEEIKRITTTRAGIIKKTGEPFECCLSFLSVGDVDRICRLQSDVLAVAPSPLPLYVRDDEFFAKCIEDRGCIVGAQHGENLIGYAVLCVPGSGEENYGLELGFAQSELEHVGHLAGSGVHPDYRGNGLQSCLVDLRGLYALSAGYHHLCGEVLPENAISIQNHLSNGYFLKGFKIDRFDLSVYMLHKDMRVEPELAADGKTLEAPIHDVAAYRRMMDSGHWGFGLTGRDGLSHITYGKFV